MIQHKKLQEDGTLNFGQLFKFTDNAPAELRANGFDGSKVTKSATISVYQSVPAPATGDSSNMWVYAIILIVAAVGVAACVIVTIRKKKNQ